VIVTSLHVSKSAANVVITSSKWKIYMAHSQVLLITSDFVQRQRNAEISRLGKEVRNVQGVQCSLLTVDHGAEKLHD
jgi:hypothetical protein